LDICAADFLVTPLLMGPVCLLIHISFAKMVANTKATTGKAEHVQNTTIHGFR